MADCSGGHRAAHAAVERLAVAARLHEPKGAVGRGAVERIGEVVTDVGRRVEVYVGSPHLRGVVQYRLVEQGQVGGAHHPATARHADHLYRGVIEAGERGGRHLGRGERSDAERGFQLIGAGRSADDMERRRHMWHPAQHPFEAGRRRHSFFQNIAIVATGHRLDDLGEHPVRGRRVVLELRTRLPVEPPRAECLPPTARRVAALRSKWCRRKPRGMQHHLLDGDLVLAV